MKQRKSNREMPLHVSECRSETWKEVFDNCDAHLRTITGLLLGGDKQVITVLLRAKKSLERYCAVPACPLEAYWLARRRVIHYVLQVLEPERQMKLKAKSSSTEIGQPADNFGSYLPEQDGTALLASLKTLLHPAMRL